MFTPFHPKTPANWLEDCIHKAPNDNSISQIYDLLLSVASPSLDHLKLKWEEDLVKGSLMKF